MELVLKHLGYLLLIFSVFPFIPIFASVYYGEPMLPFLVPIFFSAVIGYYLVNKYSEKSTSFVSFDISRSISLSVLSFIAISLIGMMPYAASLRISFIDALFESVAGFSTTGLTIFDDVEILPKSLLLWRAETQWIGGIGIILLFLIIVSAMRAQDSLRETATKARAVATLYFAQGASNKLEANIAKSIRHTVMIYFAYTFAGILLLYFVGLSVFESIAITFTALATGGFSVTNTFYTAWPVLLAITLIMIAGSVSFVFHNSILKGYIKEFFTNKTFVFFMGAMLIAVFSVFAYIRDFKIAFFETISAFTTTGFSISDISVMPAIVIFLLILCMIIGGMLGGTAGGIKIPRLRLMLYSIPFLIKKTASPSGAVIPLKMDGEVIDNEQIIITNAFVGCYMITIILGSIILMVTGLSFLDSSFQVVSAIGTVGLQTTPVSLFHPVAKIVLIIAMLFGRLEIFPLFVLGKLVFDKSRRWLSKREEVSRKLFYTKWIPTNLWKRKF